MDLAEMGAPEGLVGRVVSIQASPEIEDGSGRVVLTTVSHINSDVYELTVRSATGDVETLGVTGSHRFYEVAKGGGGWVETRHLEAGVTLRGMSGDLTVLEVARDTSAERVYNFTVEADHVYYVGDLTALTHNQCKPDANLGGVTGDGVDAAHLVPKNMVGSVFEFMRNVLEAAKIDLDDSINGFLTNDSRHLGTHTTDTLPTFDPRAS